MQWKEEDDCDFSHFKFNREDKRASIGSLPGFVHKNIPVTECAHMQNNYWAIKVLHAVMHDLNLLGGKVWNTTPSVQQ